MLAPSKSSPLSFLLSGFAATLIGTASSALAIPEALSSNPATPASASANLNLVQSPAGEYGNIPLHFERNVGQAGSEVQYLARGAGYGLFIEPDSVILGLRHAASKAGDAGTPAPRASAQTSDVRMQLVAANRTAPADAEGPLAGYSNYLIGTDRSRWHTHVPQFEHVRYRDIYPHIDLVYYGNQQQLEYDFVVAPGGNPQSIRLQYTGIEAARVDDLGNLRLQVAGAELVEHRPTVYQTRNGSRRPVDGQFRIVRKQDTGVEVAFALADYDRTLPLVIDPILSYSTFLGGPIADTAGGIAVDRNGSAYVTGSTVSMSFPTTAGAVQIANAGQSDAFVTKLSADGTRLTYSTYLGGSLDDFSSAIAVDANGAAYVAGNTISPDFPVTPGAIQSTLDGSGTSDAFVAKLSPDGSSLTYATYLGGSDNDSGSGIAVDSHGSAYVAGLTYSKDFPYVAGGISKSMPGRWDTFVAKISTDGSRLLHSTYLGGVNDTPASIAVDSTGAAYVTGSATTAFPVTAGAYQTVNAGPHDVYVSKISPDGKSFAYSTFLGGSANDVGYGIAVDSKGSAYVTGATVSSDFPVTPSAFQTKNRTRVSGSFVTKFSADGSSLVYSTYLDGTEQDTAVAIAVDNHGRAYVTGSTQSTDFPVTQGAPKGSLTNGDTDGFVSVLNSTGAALVYSTFMGGSASDTGKAIAVDSAGNAYVAGESSSADFPTTAGAFQTGFNGAAQEVFAFRFAPFTAYPSALDFGDINAGSVSGPQTLAFSNDGFNPITLTSVTTATQSYRRATTCTSSLAPGASCNITVRFAPTQVGAAEDTLTIGTSDGPALVKLKGIGAGRGAVLSPTALDFGDQLVGTVSATQFVTITNPGTLNVSVTGISISGSFTQTNACILIAPGASCPINVRFTPPSTGPATGVLTVSTNAYQNPAPVNLSGTGVAPVVNLSATSLGFGNQDLGTTSSSQAIQLTNSGTGSLDISSIIPSAPFSQTNDCGSKLASGAHCTINVAFSPTVTGSISGSLTIASNAASSPSVVTLSGTGVGPQLKLSTTSLAFGNLPVNTTSGAKTVTVTNAGTATLTISGVTPSSGYLQTNNCGALSAGASCSINVSFAPTSAGYDRGSLLIASNAFTSPDTVKLAGNGVVVPIVSLSPSSLSFGSYNLGTTSSAKAIQLANTGAAALSISSIVASSPFNQTNTCGSSVAPASQCTINVTFRPTLIGAINGAVTLTTNASTSPDTVSLSGSGIGPQASLSPASLAFGGQAANTTSRSQTVTITNTGTTSLSIGGASVSSNFVLMSNTCTTLSPGSSCAISVSFSPPATGPFNGTLSITTNAYDSPSQVPLSGTGI